MSDVTPSTVSVRAYARTCTPERPNAPAMAEPRNRSTPPTPSEWSLTFDTETTIDSVQRLKFGVFQIRKGDVLKEEGMFCDAEALTATELRTIERYAESQGLRLLTHAQFLSDVFLRVTYDYRGLCIGFNLPFDLSRIALDAYPSRGDQFGGFSFVMSPYKDQPRVQVKHLSSRCALMRFTVPGKQFDPRSMRSRGFRVQVHRGFFVDVKTFACALLSGIWSLGTLAKQLETKTQKLDTDEHGKVTAEYLRYARADVQSTWDCFVALRDRYEGFNLETPFYRIQSEAGLGKAYLRQMGVRPWREVQPNFSPETIGWIMSAYFGGRAEVNIRRTPVRVAYLDFLSMYPTVCVLMNLWQFVTARGVTTRESAEETQELLDRLTLQDVQRPETWSQLATLVLVLPEDDRFPVRARYDGTGHSIGLNRLTSKQPLWYTLADCLASKLLTGRAPKVVRALTFTPQEAQNGLRAVHIAGSEKHSVEPYGDDFYRSLIELRTTVKRSMKDAESQEKDRLDAEQLTLKICANATSYGIFAELVSKEHAEGKEVECFGRSGNPFATKVLSTEDPGRYFHPLLAALITGAARLMLASAETVAKGEGLDWALCDTDSLALTPEDIGVEAPADFMERVERVREWFTPLYPYRDAVPGEKPSLLKLEDINSQTGSEALEPLYGFAVSAKRYALYNLGKDGEPILRKASAHGLGHLLAPYGSDSAPESAPEPQVKLSKIGVGRWQHDLWHRMVSAAYTDQPTVLRLEEMSGLDAPAVSRYGAATPALLRWFNVFNFDKPYSERIKPFGFLLCFHGKEDIETGEGVPKAVAPFDKKPERAALQCFDRDTGEPVGRGRLKSYREALSRYHLRPESKFLGGSYFDSGRTERRHVVAESVEHLGKESVRWEERMHVGETAETQTVYGKTEEDRESEYLQALTACGAFTLAELGEAAGISTRELSRIAKGEVTPSQTTLVKLLTASRELKQKAESKEARERLLLDSGRSHSKANGLRVTASRLNVNHSNLAAVFAGRRKPSDKLLDEIERLVEELPAIA